MPKRRNIRQESIRKIIREKPIRTQSALVAELDKLNYNCTQATISRDIADMGLKKLPEGVYVLAEDLHLQKMVSELVCDVLCAENLVIIKAQPGTAPGIAAAIDAAELSGSLGSIAGNDTLMVVTRSAEDAENFKSHINNLRKLQSSKKKDQSFDEALSDGLAQESSDTSAN